MVNDTNYKCEFGVNEMNRHSAENLAPMSVKIFPNTLAPYFLVRIEYFSPCYNISATSSYQPENSGGCS